MKHQNHALKITTLLVLAACLVLHATAHATTKGLSEIVTPDLQKEGELSLSFQAQDKRIGNPFELQAEMGLTSWFEVAMFQGLKPSEQIFGAEIALVQHKPWLLSAGFTNWSTRGVAPQPFLEGGWYYGEHHKLIVGAAYVSPRMEAILGYAYDFNERWRAQVDFQSGPDNSVAFGFTCNVTENFQFNPALYVSNNKTHDVMGYIVFTYTLPLWKPRGDAKN